MGLPILAVYSATWPLLSPRRQIYNSVRFGPQECTSRTWCFLHRFLKIYASRTCEPRKLWMRSLSNAPPSRAVFSSPPLPTQFRESILTWTILLGSKIFQGIGIWVLGFGLWFLGRNGVWWSAQDVWCDGQSAGERKYRVSEALGEFSASSMISGCQDLRSISH